MSYFGRNIRKIRNAKKISQTAFADLFNLKRGSISAYEEGRAEAKIDTVIEIAEYFKLTLDQLLRNELTINQIYHIDEKNRKILNKDWNKDEQEKIPLILEKSQLDFIKKNNDTDFIQSLPFIRLNNSTKQSLAFECKGNLLISSDYGIKPEDIIVAYPFDFYDVNKYTASFVTVCIVDNQLRIGKIYHESNKIKIKFSDGNDFIYQKQADVKIKIWKAYKLIINELSVSNQLESRILSLEKKIDDLLKKVR